MNGINNMLKKYIEKILSIFKKKNINEIEKRCLNCKFFIRTHDDQCNLYFFNCVGSITGIKTYELNNIKREEFRQGFFPDDYFCKYFKFKKIT
jgi:hypothetical protein